MPIQFTDEQARPIACDAPFIVVNAYAGTGKTTMLDGYTVARPTRSFLYLAFNKALQLEAERRFGPNTLCKTTHALAFPTHGVKYKHKLGNFRALDFSERFGLDYIFSRWTLETLNNFIASTDKIISEVHLPAEVRTQISMARVIEFAREAWVAIVDRSDSFPMTHDGYLKLFAMSEPDLSSRFDTILFDEAQDANPVTTQIVMAQKNMQVVMVGDRYQSIYGFRGAQNAMEMCDQMKAARFHLTKSFRFGTGIAAAATLLLNGFFGAQRPVIGLGKHQKTSFAIDTDKQYALIARTNSGIFEAAVGAVQNDRPFCLLGGFESYHFEKIVDAYWLFKGERSEIRDAFTRRFESFEEATLYAEEAQDIGFRAILRTVETYRDQIPHLCEQVRLKVLPDAPQLRARANIVMTTAHRAKGLEFDQVRLADDFMDLIDPESGEPTEAVSRKVQEEINLAYVALTRAERAIELNSAIKNYLRWHRQQSTASRPAMAIA